MLYTAARRCPVSVVYFCWLCDTPLDNDQLTTFIDVHYTDQRLVRFCSPAHWAAYQDLKAL